MSFFEVIIAAMIGTWLSDLVPVSLLGIASIVFGRPESSSATPERKDRP